MGALNSKENLTWLYNKTRFNFYIKRPFCLNAKACCINISFSLELFDVNSFKYPCDNISTNVVKLSSLLNHEKPLKIN